MQYFKDELWTLMNVGTEEEQQAAEEEWDRNALAYWVRFKSMEGRVSKRVHQFFGKRGFHDWCLVKFEVIHDPYGVQHPVKVLVTVENHAERWQLQYHNVTQVKVDYTEGDTRRRGFDDWGYDELLDVDEATLSHEVLFASGATYRVQFANRSMFVQKLSNKAPIGAV